ncbi:hypothetical protein AYR66_10905 [Noviherbaspirillum denitrificans]|uniref:Uncharacterized protein n=1 Tax=Noviherbaspirillum denitrificans TaxID=1968433 RepID=A0A254TBL2_9BURK|nr:hypothetical protein AYR66_10905 [Noviherbaspirillum denitrificans]
MLLHVETRPGLHGDKEPVAFMLGNTRVEVAEILDRWIGSDHSYFRICASDHATYILRHEPLLNQWELTLFKAQI